MVSRQGEVNRKSITSPYREKKMLSSEYKLESESNIGSTLLVQQSISTPPPALSSLLSFIILPLSYTMS